MKVLVIGSRGNMGRRFSAIIRHLGHDLLEYDPPAAPYMPDFKECDACIIATPVVGHMPYLKTIMPVKPVLCEKPLSFDLAQVKAAASYAGKQGCAAYMVNNWAFVGHHREPMSEGSIVVNTWNTGTDGDWDLIQPLYLVEDISNFECVRKYPWLSVAINGVGYGRDDFDISYVEMVQAFLDGEYDKLWPVANMVTAHERVIEYGKRL
jgi:hypothetical protein